MSPESYAEKILILEKDIAYFFGVGQPEFVARHYIEAIKLLEKRNEMNAQELKKRIVPHLEAAYAEVKEQTCFNFDVLKAASLEFDLLIANIEHESFEKEYALLLSIYNEVFGTITQKIQSAALLRTFLYKYKNHLMSSAELLSDDDIVFLRLIAERTEIELEAFKSNFNTQDSSPGVNKGS